MTPLLGVGVGAGIVQDAIDLYERDPQLKHRGFYKILEHPEIGKYHATGPAFRLSKANFNVRRAPLLGEHNESILKGICHLTDEEIGELIASGAVE
jgi:benzylsuccinate CoA-transferase BbsF subunit